MYETDNDHAYSVSEPLEQVDIFDLQMDDATIVAAIRKRIDEANATWEKREGLSQIRKTNIRYWKGDQWDRSRYYRYNELYTDNRILPAIESIISHVTSKTPQPEVRPAANNDTSIHFAKDLSIALKEEADIQNYSRHMRSAARNLLLRRLGMLKLRYDEDLDQIVTESINPEDVIIDYDTKMGENPSFIAQRMRTTIQELVYRFPAAKKKIYEAYGIERGVLSQTTRKGDYEEIWFSYFDKKGVKQEAVVWMIGKVVLGKMRNPNWIYKKNMEESREANFLNYPEKPFIPINYLNDGESYIDQTSVTEQAINQQDIVNKHGKQITENANRANPQKVFSGKAITKSDIEDLTGDPNESILLDAEDVRTAMTTIVTPSLPAYIRDNMDGSRNNIDTLYGTFNVFRGEQSGNATLGQDTILRNQAIGRQDDIVRAIDAAADKYFKYLAQMMKVYYTEDHWYQTMGEDGKFDFVVCSSDNIEPKAIITVKSGSTLPVDKDRLQTISLGLAKLGLIDPMTLYEDLDLPNPSKRFERLVKYKVDQTQLLESIKSDEYDAEAFRDIITINGKLEAEPRSKVTEQHLAYHREYMMSGEFQELDPEIKQKHIDHVTLETEKLRQVLLAQETQLPNDQDYQAAAQRDAIMNQLSGQPEAPQGANPGQGSTPPPNGAQGAPMQPTGQARQAAMGSLPQNMPTPPPNAPGQMPRF